MCLESGEFMEQAQMYKSTLFLGHPAVDIISIHLVTEYPIYRVTEHVRNQEPLVLKAHTATMNRTRNPEYVLIYTGFV